MKCSDKKGILDITFIVNKKLHECGRAWYRGYTIQNLSHRSALGAGQNTALAFCLVASTSAEI
jgi:hypothetical protein